MLGTAAPGLLLLALLRAAGGAEVSPYFLSRAFGTEQSVPATNPTTRLQNSKGETTQTPMISGEVTTFVFPMRKQEKSNPKLGPSWAQAGKCWSGLAGGPLASNYLKCFCIGA